VSRTIEEIQWDIRREKGRLRSTATVMDWDKHSVASARVCELGEELEQALSQAKKESRDE
jgi:hypothetical protein